MTTTAETDRDEMSALDGMAPSRPAPSSGTLGVLPELFALTTPTETVRTVARLARLALGCDEAGVVLLGLAGGPVATAAAGTGAARADALQVEHQEGPALAAVVGSAPVVAADLRSDSRWRFWGPTTADLGFRSVLSLPLTDGVPSGALTLYSRRPSFFRPERLDAEQQFAQQASLAIAAAAERDQLVRARDSHGIIGQALGILMQRYDMSADQAFAALRRSSSQLGSKVRVVAELVIRDRRLPAPDHQ